MLCLHKLHGIAKPWLKRSYATVFQKYKHSCTDLRNLKKEELQSYFQNIEYVLCDADGVLWVLGGGIEGSAAAVNQFKKLGKKVYMITNSSIKTRKDLVAKANRLGFQINQQEIISAPHSLATYLKSMNFKKKAFVIGSDGITQELDAVGIPHNTVGPDLMPSSASDYVMKHLKLDEKVGAVVMGFDKHFSVPKMIQAATYLSHSNCLFLATNPDERITPLPHLVIPGTGSFVKAIETCSKRQAKVIGKPNREIVEFLINDGSIKPDRTLIIGDRCNIDILLGYNCGFQTLLVGSGMHKLSDVQVWKKSNDPELHKLVPDVYLPKLGDFLSLF